MKRVQQDTTSSHAGSGQRILFTGPDGIGDFRPKLDYFPRSIGIGPLSPDATSDLNYLFRPAAHATPPLPKHRCTGEVGWGLQYCTALNRRTTVINHNQAHSALVSDKQTTCRRLAWNHSAHDTYSKDDSEQFPLNEVCSKDGYGESTTRRITFSLEIDKSRMVLESDH